MGGECVISSLSSGPCPPIYFKCLVFTGFSFLPPEHIDLVKSVVNKEYQNTFIPEIPKFYQIMIED